MTIFLGVAYPLLITGIAQLFFSEKANGSLIEKNGKIIGSKLIAQQANDSLFFEIRPSAVDYQTIPSGASNLGLTNKKLYGTVENRKIKFIKRNNLPEKTIVPSEMIFASGSGLDPHISPEAAQIQVDRIANNRHFLEKQKQQLYVLIKKHTESPQFGIFGEERVNVLMLNLELAP